MVPSRYRLGADGLPPRREMGRNHWDDRQLPLHLSRALQFMPGEIRWTCGVVHRICVDGEFKARPGMLASRLAKADASSSGGVCRRETDFPSAGVFSCRLCSVLDVDHQGSERNRMVRSARDVPADLADDSPRSNGIQAALGIVQLGVSSSCSESWLKYGIWVVSRLSFLLPSPTRTGSPQFLAFAVLLQFDTCGVLNSCTGNGAQYSYGKANEERGSARRARRRAATEAQ